MIPVTQAHLPPKEKYIALLDTIWGNKWLTNNGPYVQKLEQEIKKHLGIYHCLYCNIKKMITIITNN